ncbi:uncharacterized protein LOC107304717 [Oryza brachyantha]|uniref:uncharacterized protein LOC107304717 n=1 Tax=Oryza brachyantha TaxID=4533 RepID=UPI001ADBB5E2|nr:uncharacterized protein LOC107304717 [Oryza brachyantha]
MAIREFDELALDGSNYPIWASDMKINFASRGIIKAIEDPVNGDAPVEDKKIMSAFFFLRLYIHKDLKHEYMLEMNPFTLWKALKERYDQQKELIWPEANFEWSQLRLQDFKTMTEFNHVVHQMCSKLKFCEKEPTEVEKIEKALSTMLPEDRILNQQYRANNFQRYSQLIHTLTQAEKHHELSLKNAQQRPPGSAPLPEVHFNAKYNVDNTKGFMGNSSDNPKNSTGKRKHNNRRKFKGRKKGNGKGKAPHGRRNNNKHCDRCGSDYHVAKDCRIPKHLVLLYQKSLKEKKSSEEPRYEAHCNLTNEARLEIGSSQKALVEPENNLDLLPEDVGPLSSTDDMLIEFCSMDPLGDFQ